MFNGLKSVLTKITPGLGSNICKNIIEKGSFQLERSLQTRVVPSDAAESLEEVYDNPWDIAVSSHPDITAAYARNISDHPKTLGYHQMILEIRDLVVTNWTGHILRQLGRDVPHLRVIPVSAANQNDPKHCQSNYPLVI